MLVCALVNIKATFCGRKKTALIFLGTVFRALSVKENFGMSYNDNLQEKIKKMREKYRAEREKRLRSDGSDQFVEVKGKFSYFSEDPSAKVIPERESVVRETDIVIVGGGFGGLLAAARLNAIGYKDITVVEEGADFGGTWYWNRYPGAQCDIESYVYMPLLEEVGYMPSEKYAHGDEIFEHSRSIGKHFGLYGNALFQTRMVDAEWKEGSSSWKVLTDRGDSLHTKFLVLATGNLTKPKLPGIPGIEKFEGHMFHTSRWDYSYTGSGGNRDLSGLRDKRVAIIGSGATAVQVVPKLAQSVQQLYVCQRTPSTIDIRGNEPTDTSWYKNLEPGWQERRIQNFTNVTNGVREDEDLVADGWTDLMHKMIEAFREKKRGVDLGVDPISLAQYRKMEEIRARVEDTVIDKEAAEALKPYYDMFCKRPCFHDEYLNSFNRENVTLLDTDGRGVDSITPHGLIVKGKEYAVDCIIFATGFEVGSSMERRVGIDLLGKGERRLSEKWRDGPRTLHGIHTEGFPNCFVMHGVQSTISFNVPHHLDEQAKTIADILGYVRKNKLARVEASVEAEQSWVDQVISSGQKVSTMNDDPCTPGYYNNEGQPKKNGRYYRAYGGGPTRYFKKLKEWRNSGKYEGLNFS